MQQGKYVIIGSLIVLALLAVGFGTRTVWAQTGTPTPGPAQAGSPRVITVSGDGQADARPDQAVVNLGVQTDAPTAGAALTTNSQQMQGVLNAVQQAGIAAADVQTQQVQLSPRYDNPGSEGGPAKPAGYTASNVVRVRVRDLSKLGSLLDTAVQAGGNRIEGISFEVSDMTNVAAHARDAAWNDALAKAQQLAGLAGDSLGQVLSISESTQIPRPFLARASVAAADSGVPVEPGTQTVAANLQVTWALVGNTTGGRPAPSGTSVAPATALPAGAATGTIGSATVAPAGTLPAATGAATSTAQGTATATP